MSRERLPPLQDQKEESKEQGGAGGLAQTQTQPLSARLRTGPVAGLGGAGAAGAGVTQAWASPKAVAAVASS